MTEVIRVQCGGCDVKIKAPVKYQGRQVDCPQCSHPVKIPRLNPASQGSEVGRRSESVAVAPIIEDYEQPAELGDDAFVDDEPKVRKRPPKDDFGDFDLDGIEDYGHPDDYDAPPRPRNRSGSTSGSGRKKRRKKKASTASTSSHDGGIEPSIIGGILMMVGAVVWFVVGWNFGIIFVYPLILFIVGVAAFVKGLFD